MLRLSHAHLCSEHFAEWDFVNFIGRNTKWGLLQSGICRAVYKVTDLDKIPVRISKDEADEQQPHSTIPKTERYTDTLKQAQRQKLYTNAYGRKGNDRKRPYTNACRKERKNRPQMSWQRKKEQTTNAGGKRKMASLISQANSWHQMKETKQLKPPQNPKRLPTCKHKSTEQK